MGVPWCTSCADTLERLGAQEADSAEDLRRRRIGSSVLLIASILAFLSLAAYVLAEPAFFNFWRAGCALLMLNSLIGVVGALRAKNSALSISRTIVVEVIAILMMDFQNAANLTPRSVGLVVIILDCCLLLALEVWVQKWVIGITFVYLAVERMEAFARIGMYDTAEFGITDDIAWMCDCSDPPCQRQIVPAAFNYAVWVFIFATDFILTRNFANGMRAQVALVEASIHVADQVTEALARFDLSAAGEALSQADTRMPLGLSTSLRRLLGNLSSYRPYLPQSCFEHHEEAESSDLPHTIISQGSERSSGRGSEGQPTGASIVRTASGVSSKSKGSSATGEAEPRASVAHHPQFRRVTLLQRNSTGFLAAVGQVDEAAAGVWVAAEVERFASIVQGQSGLVEMLSGDHYSASFGALKAQGTQKAGATRAAVLATTPQPAGPEPLGSVRATSAVCSGRALCGDFGSTAVQRFMVIGGVSSFLPAAERAAAAWGIEALIDSAVHVDIQQSWSCRLRKQVRFPKLTARQVGLWEVLKQRQQQDAEPAEWMYEMVTGEDPWHSYNEAVKKWYESGPQAVRDIVAAGTNTSRGEAAEAFSVLSALAQADAAAPEGMVTVGTFPGSPIPLSMPRDRGALLTPPSMMEAEPGISERD